MTVTIGKSGIFVMGLSRSQAGLLGGSRNPMAAAHSGWDTCAESGCLLRARPKCAECGCFPGRDTGCVESECFPGRDDSCAEDGYFPDEINYYDYIVG